MAYVIINLALVTILGIQFLANMDDILTPPNDKE